jgi:hypothetical protein
MAAPGGILAVALLAAAGAPQSVPAPPQPQLAPLTAPDIVPLVPPPAEYTLSLRQDEWRVHVTLRPGEPQPGRLAELIFDLGRQRDGEAGEPQAFTGGKLALTINGPGSRARYLVRPLGDAGVYGVHWTPPARGLWTLSLAPYQDAGPTLSFQVGAGVPMPASSQGHMVQSSRVVVSAGGAAALAPPTVKQLMDDLARRWQAQADAAQPEPAELKAMAKLLRAAQGHVPRHLASDGPEFDALAAGTAALLDKGALPDASSCLKCHVKFRDGWVADLSRWPEVKPWKR